MTRVLLVALLASSGTAHAQAWSGGEDDSVGGAGGGLTEEQVLQVVQDSNLLPAANRDLFANSFVASNLAPNGNPGKYSFISNTDSCIKGGAGPQAELCFTGNSLTLVVGDVTLPTAFFAQPACLANQDCFWFSQGWFGTFPSGTTPVCASNKEGGLKGNSTDHELYYCNGTTNQQVAFTATPWSASLDFGVFSDIGCQKQSFVAAGVARDELLTSGGGCGSVIDADTELLCAIAATDTNEITVRVCCIDTLGCVNLDPITFSAAAVR